MQKPTRSAAPRPAPKRPARRKTAPAPVPVVAVARDIWARRDVWPAPRVAAPAVERLERGRFALAGVVLALVAVGGGVLVGVGGRTMKEGIA